MRRGIDDERREPADPRTSGGFDMMDALDLLGRRLGGAIAIAGALIGIGIYASRGGDEAQTYQAFAADGEVFRVNTDSGRIIACNATRCMQILERGQDLAEDQGGTLFKLPPPSATPAAQPPAPSAQQAPQPAPAVVAPKAPAVSE